MAADVEIERMVVKLIGDALSYQRMLRVAQSETRSAVQEIERDALRMESIQNRIDGIGAMITGLGAAMTVTGGVLTGIFGSIGQSAIMAAAQFEQTTISFETMLGSAREAQEMLADLTKFAALTPYEMPDVQAAAMGLVQFGERGEELMDTLKMLGNAASGTGTNFGFLTLVFNQIRGVGKLLTQDFRQLSTRGILSLEDIAKYFGVTTQKAQEMLSSGQITFEAVRGIFKMLSSEGGRFFNLMERQSDSLLGKWSMLMDNIGIFKRELGEQFMPIAKRLVQWAIDLTEYLIELSPTTKKVIGVTVGLGAGLVALLATGGGLVIMLGQIATAYDVLAVKAWRAKQAQDAFTTSSKVTGALTGAGAASVAGGGPIGRVIDARSRLDTIQQVIGQFHGPGGAPQGLKIQEAQATVAFVRAQAAATKELNSSLGDNWQKTQLSEATLRKFNLTANNATGILGKLNQVTLSGTLNFAAWAAAAAGAGIAVYQMLPSVQAADQYLAKRDADLADYVQRLQKYQERVDKMSGKQTPEEKAETQKQSLVEMRKEWERQQDAFIKARNRMQELGDKGIFTGSSIVDNIQAYRKAAKDVEFFGKTSKQAGDMYLEAVKKAKEASPEAVASEATIKMQEMTKALQHQAATLGMTANEAKIYQAILDRVDPKAIQEFTKAMRELEAGEASKRAEDLAKSWTEQAKTLGLNKRELMLYQLNLTKAEQGTHSYNQAVKAMNELLDKEQFEEQNKRIQEYSQAITDMVTEMQVGAREAGILKDILNGIPEALAREKAATEDLQKSLEEGKQIIEQYLPPQEKFLQQWDKLMRIKEAGGFDENMEEFHKAMKAAKEELVEARANAEVDVLFRVTGIEAIREGTAAQEELHRNALKLQERNKALAEAEKLTKDRETPGSRAAKAAREQAARRQAEREEELNRWAAEMEERGRIIGIVPSPPPGSDDPTMKALDRIAKATEEMAKKPSVELEPVNLQ